MHQEDGKTPADELVPDASSVDLSGHSLDDSDLDNTAEIAVSSAEFPTLGERKRSETGIPLDRFYDVTVRVWAELGQVTLPIGEMLQFGEGTVMKLSRPVSDPYL